jgi:hypothetical protein
MFDRQNNLSDRVVSGLDLLVDLATLGEYGIETMPAGGRCEERRGRATRSGRTVTWEALPQPRRGACRPAHPRRTRQRLDRWYAS